MAEFIQSVPSMGDVTRPTDAGEIIRTSQWGIDATLSSYIIQNVQINKTVITDDTFDQKGQLVSQLDYDERWDMSMEVIGGDGDEDATLPGLSAGMLDFTWNNKKWKVTGITYNGTYNDKKRYTVTAFRTHSFPAQT